MARVALAVAILGSVACGQPASPTQSHAIPRIGNDAHPHEQRVYGLAKGVGTLSPTIAPTPEPTATPPPPPTAAPQGIDTWLAASPWPEYLWPEVRSVAWCESRHDPNAVGDGSYGLMQLWLGWFDYVGLPQSSWAEPVANLTAAWGAYTYSNGWGQWSCRP